MHKWWTDRIKDKTEITILPSAYGTNIPGSSLYAYVLDVLSDFPREPNDPAMYTLKSIRKILVDFRVPVFAIELLRVQKLYSYWVKGKHIVPETPEMQLRVEKIPYDEWIRLNYGKVMGKWASKGTSKYEI